MAYYMSMWFKQKSKDSYLVQPKLAYNTGNLVETIWRDHEFFRTERASFVVAEMTASEAFGK